MTSSIQTTAPTLPYSKEATPADFNKLCQLLRLYFVRLDTANLATSNTINELVALLNGEGMSVQKKQLGQVSPATTSATLLYMPPANTSWVGDSLVVSNVSGSAATFQVFHDKSGSTYSVATALFYDVAIAANTTLVFPKVLAGAPGGTVAVRSSIANTITFTLYGLEYV